MIQLKMTQQLVLDKPGGGRNMILMAAGESNPPIRLIRVTSLSKTWYSDGLLSVVEFELSCLEMSPAKSI